MSEPFECVHFVDHAELKCGAMCWQKQTLSCGASGKSSNKVATSPPGHFRSNCLTAKNAKVYVVRKRIILPKTAAILLLTENIAGVYKKLELLVQNLMHFSKSVYFNF